MQTAAIIHPSDPRKDSTPLTVVVRKLGRVESMKRNAALRKQLVPYQVIGPDGKPAVDENGPVITWRRPTDVTSGFDTYETLLAVFVEAKNVPAGVTITKDDIWELFDERWNVDVPLLDKDGKPLLDDAGQKQVAPISFPLYVLGEWGKPGTFADPTVPTSAQP